MISQILIPLKMCSLYKTHLFQHGRVEESETEVGEETEPRYLKCLSRNDGQLVQVSLFLLCFIRRDFYFKGLCSSEIVVSCRGAYYPAQKLVEYCCSIF